MNWRKVSIGELGRIVTGKTPPTGNREFYDGEYPFVTPTDLDWQSYIVRSTHSSVTELARDRNKNQFIPANSTVFTCIGNTIGKCGLSTVDCLTNQQINSVVPADEHDPKFIYYLLNYHRPQIRSLGLGNGAAQPIINKTTFSGVKVSVPATRDDEQRIATILSAYDDLIENNRRRIALLEEAARQLYKEWFVRFRFPGHEHVKIIDGLPEGWERKSIAELSSFLARGITPIYDEDATGLIINQKCIRDSKVSLEPARSQSKTVPDNKLVRKFDVLINSTGAGTLGRVAQNLYDHENLTVDSHVTIARPDKNVAPVWFGISLTLKQDFLATLGRGATNQTELSKDDVGAILVHIPKSHLLWEFEKQADDCATMVMNLISQNDQLAKARDLLLPKLMSGAIPV